jgi:hypothetical protein
VDGLLEPRVALRLRLPLLARAQGVVCGLIGNLRVGSLDRRYGTEETGGGDSHD